MSLQDDTAVHDDTIISGRKRVRLSQEAVIFPNISDDFSDLERELTWWRQEDFEEAKASVKRMCRGLRQERRFSNCLTDAYERACGMTASIGPAASTGSDIESLRTNPEFTGLFGDHGPRGLERLSSRLHALRRQRHMQEIKHAVFLEQARQNISNQRNSELLAMHAEFASRKPRAFACLLGHADAWVANEVEESSDSESATEGDAGSGGAEVGSSQPTDSQSDEI